MGSTAFQEARDLLKKLHDLIAARGDESPEGDAIRDEMDRVWRLLTSDEHRLLEGLSADLYSLVGDETKDPKFAGVPSAEVERRLHEAYRSRRYEETLELLRYPSAKYPADSTAFVRARCWEGLGDLEIALWFMEHSERTALRTSRYGVLVLEILRKLGRQDVRVDRARHYLQDATAHPDVVFMAMVAVYDPRASASDLETILDAADRALNRSLAIPAADRNPHLGLIGVAVTAASRLVRGHATTIVDAYAPMIDKHGVFDFVWTAYGLDLAETDRRASIEAFNRAIAMRTSLFYPYRLRARWAIEARDYQDAIRVSEEAATYLRDRDLGQVLELHAVARFLAGNKSEDVAALLQDAVTRSPWDMRLADNYARFSGSATTSIRDLSMFSLPAPPPWRPHLTDPPPATDDLATMAA